MASMQEIFHTENTTVQLPGVLLVNIRLYDESDTAKMKVKTLLITTQAGVVGIPASVTSEKIYVSNASLKVLHSKGLCTGVGQVIKAPPTILPFKRSSDTNKIINPKFLASTINYLKLNLDAFPEKNLYMQNTLAILAMIYPSLIDDLELYLLNPDEGVSAVISADVDMLIELKSGMILDSAIPVDASPKMTMLNGYFLALVILLYIGKKPALAKQTIAVLDKRYTSLANTLALNPGEVLGNSLITHDQLMLISNSFSFKPKLKTLIYNTVLMNAANKPDDDNTHRFSLHLKVLLTDTQMTLFTLIDEFIMTPQKTMAHLNPIIMAEMRKFLAVKERKMTQYADLYRFCKLYDPTNQDMAMSNWQTLGSVAYLWAGSNTNSMVNMLTSKLKLPLGIAAELQKFINQDLLISTPGGELMTEQYQRELYAKMGIDYEKFKAAEKAYTDQHIPTVNTFLEFIMNNRR